jgi:hypothetical protein
MMMWDYGIMPAIVMNKWCCMVEVRLFLEVCLLSLEVLAYLFILALNISNLSLQILKLNVQGPNLLVAFETACLVYGLRGGRVR